METYEGLDASHYQGQIDWKAVKASGRSWAIVKAGEGADFTDPYFARNWVEIKAAGMARGAYYFLRPDVDPTLQAQRFFKIVGELTAGDLIPWVDIEAIEPNDLWQDSRLSERQTLVNTFLGECDALFGARTGIYTAPGWWNDTFGVDYDHSGRALWDAHPGDEAPTTFPGRWKFVTIWQRSWTGTVPGIVGAGTVDLDTCLVRLPTVIA